LPVRNTKIDTNKYNSKSTFLGVWKIKRNECYLIGIKKEAKGISKIASIRGLTNI
jgi:hypothetical protein